MKDKVFLNRTNVYLYAFLILFTFGISVGFLRNNFKKSIQEEASLDKTLIAEDNNQKFIEKDIVQENIQENKEISSNQTESNSSAQIESISLKIL